jgi:hypothetical protein
MNMPTTRSRVLALCLLLATVPVSFAGDDAPEKKIRINQENLSKLAPADQDRVLCIAERLETIAETDKSSLSREERKALRAETRELKNEADLFNRDGQVLYISAGTLIIILLIILILT